MIDLHLHLDGSLNPKNIPDMAKMSDINLDVTEEEIRRLLMVEPDCTNLGEYLEKFDLPLQLLQTAETIEYAVYELMRHVYEQGVRYVEIRFAPQLHKQRGLTQEAVVRAAVKGLNRGREDFDMKANLILCCMRDDKNTAENIETVELAGKYLGQGICAVDLAGNEAAYPTAMFEDVFSLAGRKGIPVIIHAGEAAGADSIIKALSFGAVRIGHGIRAVEDAGLMKELMERNIFLEMCFSSNLQTKTVDDVADYPIVEFLNNNLRVTLNTDNLTVSNTTLKNEYRLVQRQFGMDETTMLKLAMNSVEAAFLPESDKNELRGMINAEFFDWLVSD